jgi:hypothetical protein
MTKRLPKKLTMRAYSEGARPRLPFSESEMRAVDKGIALEVRVLWENGVETFESCQGGKEHSSPEPIVRFHGGHAEGLRALSVAIQHGLKVAALRRYWDVRDNEIVGPYWELTFWPRGVNP